MRRGWRGSHTGLLAVVVIGFLGSMAAGEPTYKGRTAGEWLALYKNQRLGRGGSPDFEPRAALVAMGEDAVSTLATELARSDDAAVVGILRDIGEPGVLPLCACIEDRKPEFRLLLIRTLLGMREKARAAVPALVRSLADTRSTVKVSGKDANLAELTAYRLRYIGAPSKDAVPALVEALRTEQNPLMQRTAAEALERLGPDARDAVPALAEAIDLRKPKLADRAVHALGSIGGPEAVKALASRFDALPSVGAGTGYDLQGEAARALGRTKEPSALRVLVAILQRHDHPSINRVQDAFANYGEEALDLLLPLLSDEDRRIRARAAWAISEIGPRATRAVEPLRAALRDAEPSVRSAAACALGSIGPEAASAVPDLIRDIDNGNGAIQALGQIGPAARAGVRVLIRIVGDRRRDLADRALAATSLGQIGAASRRAIPTLRAVVRRNRNPDSDLRQRAEKAIEQIGKAATGAWGWRER